MTGLKNAAQQDHAKTSEDQKPAQTGFPFHKIVYVGDLSGESSYGLRYTQKLAKERHAGLVPVHSLDPIVYALPGVEMPDGAASEKLIAMELDPKRHGANHDSRAVQREQICARILGEARRHSASLLILSTEGRTVAGRMALATLARLLLPSTPCSILTIQSPTQSAALPARIWQNVIAATDFSHASVAALEIAQRIAGHGLIVLHSTQSGKEQDSHHCMTKLRMLAPFNESHTLPVEHLVHPGNVIDAIAFAERKMHADLLVLGAPSVAVDTGNLDDSTIYRLIIDSTCPVLLVPPGTALGEETIDKAVRAWMENAQCVDGRPPVGGH